MNQTELDPQALQEAILKRLAEVIDPETGADVVRMRLIEDLTVDGQGMVRYKFRPSSALCPLAAPLAVEIKQAVWTVKGVTSQEMEIVGYVAAQELMEILKQAGY